MHDRRHVRRSAKAMPDNFTIFEGTSEIQRMIIGRAVTGLDVP
jgi:alkylation response protein AidB-like acyl-CoA dehydrogenase